MKRLLRTIAILTVLCAAGLLLQGCATHIRQPASAAQPTKVRLSSFKVVAMKHVHIAPQYASSGANQKARNRIDQQLFEKMRFTFPALEEESKIADAKKSGASTLVIEPSILEIKFIGGFARFMVGAMAGNSAVLMKVTFRDAGTGEVLGEPEFYRAANAMGGAYSMGTTDNMMLDGIVQDICAYAAGNR